MRKRNKVYPLKAGEAGLFVALPKPYIRALKVEAARRGLKVKGLVREILMHRLGLPET